MSEVKLLPLPAGTWARDMHGEKEVFTSEQAEAYAIRNMEPLMAENERLRGEVEKVCADHKQVCRDYESLQEILGGKLSTVQARAERLAEALRYAVEQVPELATVPGIAAALDQEGGNG